VLKQGCVCYPRKMLYIVVSLPSSAATRDPPSPSRTMVVRATQVLQPGEEVSVSYLGTEDHAPAVMRRQASGCFAWDACASQSGGY